jgi:O-antigen/teichoic acid export membrane protein
MLFPAGLEIPVFRAMFAHDSSERQTAHVGTLATALFVGPIFLGLVAGALVCLAPPILGVNRTYVGAYVLMAGIFSAATVAPLAVLRASERFSSYAALTLAYTTVQMALRVGLVLLGGLGVRGWVIADFGSAVFVLVFSCAWQGRWLSLRRARRDDLESGLRMGLPLVPHLAAHWGLNLSDRLILAVYFSTAVVGIYSMGYQIAFVAGLAITEVNRAFMPRYGEAVRDLNARDLLSGHARLQVLATVGLAAGASLLGPQVVRLVLPSSYVGAAPIIPWVALGFLFLGFYYLPMNLVSIVAGDTKGFWRLTLCAAAVNVFTNLLFVPHFGPMAAAIDTALGFLCLLVLTSIAARRRCPSVRLDLQPIWIVVLLAIAVTVVGSLLSVRPGTSGLVAAIAAVVVVALLLTVGTRGQGHLLMVSRNIAIDLH